MSAVRIKLSGEKAVLHCIGRIVAGEMLLDDVAKETLTAMLRKMAAFCGLEVITYCMMSNHFHVLIRVSEPLQLTDRQLVERLEALYGARGALTLLAREAISERGKIDADIRGKLLERMGDVSAFMGNSSSGSAGGTTGPTSALARCGRSGSRACWSRTSRGAWRRWRRTLT